MWDSDKILLYLFEIAKERKIRVYYNHLLPDEESFIVLKDEETYIYLDLKLAWFDEVKHLAHEIAHDFVGISNKNTSQWLSDKQENAAKDWAATYLVSREKFIKTLQNPFVRNDFEAAAEMGVDIETVERIRSCLERENISGRQCDYVNWWEHCTT